MFQWELLKGNKQSDGFSSHGIFLTPEATCLKLNRFYLYGVCYIYTVNIFLIYIYIYICIDSITFFIYLHKYCIYCNIRPSRNQTWLAGTSTIGLA